jgi:hypothetical protein
MLKKLPKPRSLPKKHRAPTKPKTKALASSNVTDHSYSPETGHLTVTFHGGRSYRYEGVSKETAKGLEDAGSAGQFLNSHVIGKHHAVKIGA